MMEPHASSAPPELSTRRNYHAVENLGHLVDSAGQLESEVPIMSAAKSLFNQGVEGRQAELDIAGIAQINEAG